MFYVCMFSFPQFANDIKLAISQKLARNFGGLVQYYPFKRLCLSAYFSPTIFSCNSLLIYRLF